MQEISINTHAVVFGQPEQPALTRLDRSPRGEESPVVDFASSGIGTSDERRRWTGRTQAFPGIGAPRLSGCESTRRTVSSAERVEVDLVAVMQLAESGKGRLDGPNPHPKHAVEADPPKRIAFRDHASLKLVLDRRTQS